MKTILQLFVSALIAVFLISGSVDAQTTYNWIGSSGASWATGTNWSPTRSTPAANDILVFSGGGSKSATLIPTETIGQLLVTGNTTVSLTGNSSPARTLSITRTLSIESGSSVSLNIVNSTFTLNYSGTNATGSIAGTLIVNTGAVWNTTTGSTPSSTVSGTVINNSGTITGSTGTLTFEAGGKYQHNYATSGTIPTATWNSASTCEIIGNTSNSSAPSGLGQAFGNFEWNCPSQSGSSANFGGNLTSVAGNFKIVSTGSSSVELHSNGPWIMTISGDLIIQSGILDAQGANKETIINLGGSYNQTGGTFTTSGLSPTVTFNFTGSGKTFTQSGGTITSTFFNWSVISGASLTLNNNFPVSSGRSLIVAGRLNCGSSAVTGAGAFTLNTNATLGIGSPAGISSLANTGNIQVTGPRNYNGGDNNYVYNGSTGAQLTGNQLSATVSSLTIENSAGVSLSQAVAVSGTATFTSGILATTLANLLTINNGASVSGASKSSFVDGPMAKVGSTAFTFPIGKTGTGYQPCGISSISGSTTFTAQYFRGTPPDRNFLNAPLAAISACEYWNIRASSSVAAHITLYWNANSGCGSGAYIPGNYPYPPLRIARHRPSTNDWINASNNNSQDPSSISSNGNMTTELANGSFTTPNYFTFGTTDGSQIPLPVKFGTIKAFEKQKGVQIEWSTYSEKNVDRFEIQRSADGQSFATIGSVNAKNTESKSDYSWYDSNPLTANYYRIKIVDIDAKSDYTSIVRVSFEKTLYGISIYPNPVIGKQVSFQVADLQKGNHLLAIYSNTGQLMYRLQVVHDGGSMSQTVLLPPSFQTGMYHMQITGADKKISKPFIIQ